MKKINLACVKENNIFRFFLFFFFLQYITEKQLKYYLTTLSYW